MFRPARIFHARLYLPEDKVDSLINTFHKLGICQLKEAKAELDSKYSVDKAKEINDSLARLNFITESLDNYKPVTQPEKAIKAFLNPKPPRRVKVDDRPEPQILKDVHKHLDIIEPKVRQGLDRISKIEADMSQKRFIIENLYLMPEMKTSLFGSSDDIKVSIGIVTQPSMKKIEERLRDIAVIGYDKKDKNVLIAVFSSPEHSANVGHVLHEVGIESIEIPFENKKPIDIIKALRQNIDKLENEKMVVEKQLRDLSIKYANNLEVLAEETDIIKNKIDALRNFKATKALAVLEAWVPAKKLDEFEKTVNAVAKGVYVEINERDKAPTIFDNPKYAQPFEVIVKLFSPPKYKDFDPTPILAISFSIFFGFMLTDVVYGMLLIIFAALFSKAGRYNPGIKNISVILYYFGISTVVFGIIFGSYFGNFFQVIGINIPYLIDAMRDVMVALAIALGIGSLHMTIGLIIGFYDNCSKKQFKKAFADQGVWLFFMFGILVIIGGLSQVGLALIGLAILMQIVFKFMEGGIITSILSVFSFSGFIGDLFSYARLMALAIGTSGIALAVNFMVILCITLLGTVGIPFAIIIFIIGHIFNILMNGLGAFIHSTRLHFLEFFTKFYDGGGNIYKPFKVERKLTEVR